MLDLTRARLARAHRSVTIQFNSLVLAAIPAVDYLHDVLPEMQKYTTADTYKAIGMSVLVVNVLLRFKTNKPLEQK